MSVDIQVIEKNIHLENQKWTEKTISQRYEIDYHKRAINQQKDAYGIPEDLAATNEKTLQMVWGPGTFGYSPPALKPASQ